MSCLHFQLRRPEFPAPVVSKRGSWCTLLRFNLDAWAEKYPLIAISSDILHVERPDDLLSNFHHARIVGTATYRSPAFGWLDEEEKHAILLQLGVDDTLNAGSMKEVVEAFQLREEDTWEIPLRYWWKTEKRNTALRSQASREIR